MVSLSGQAGVKLFRSSESAQNPSKKCLFNIWLKAH